MTHFLANFFVAWAVLFFVAWGWTEVQKFSRRFKKEHSEFDGICEEKEKNCLSCGMKDMCGEKR